ncbi:alpha/beta fold hydrolase [Paracoccus sp. S1E-3]|uniref:alpha/beta fold hydrolase n=1 Tax=Paracoccus sp. S1E-3 TaxID=2756130 RepID=UPI0015EE5E47|nr:alpha/beta fold hydrolase [Paracoccus sp. S1E-3]MBA4492678.1 alpha/beta fold hydrolase [Paracoccus sp. S1E-3]
MTLFERHFPGAPDRPALALHCMMGSSNAWTPMAGHLDGQVDLRAFDNPGHGRSPDWQPEGGIDLHTFVTRHAAGKIDRPLDLIGHSFGATIALRIAVGAPEAVRSLTLIEPVLFAAAPAPSRQAEDARLAPFAAANDIDGMIGQFMSDWGAPGAGAIPDDPARADRLRKQMRLVMETNAFLMEDRADILREGGLEGIEAPVMLISGAESPPIIHEIAEALAARLPDVGRATVPGAGHMLPLTHAQAVADLTRINLARA